MTQIDIFDSPEALADATVERFISAASRAGGRFTVALPGGSTPLPVYERLADYNQSARVNWNAVHIFFGDERAVEPTHDDSNYGQAQSALLGHVPIPLENIHRIHGELGAEDAAKRYGEELQAFFDGGPPTIDLHILGMGTDGHTASLFPNAGAALHEEKHRAVATQHHDHPHPRITMTPWAINSAREVLVLVTGEKKADMLRTVLEGPNQPDTYPIQYIQPKGNLHWYVDAAAAAKLTDTKQA